MSDLKRENLLWESSRMMLPEHKEQLLQYRKERNRKQRPISDEQEQEQLSQKLSDAWTHKFPITIQVFDTYEDDTVTGIIQKIDFLSGRIQVSAEQRLRWIRLEDIVQLSNHQE